VIDLLPDPLPEIENWVEFLSLPVAVLVGFYLLGHALPMRFATAIFGIGTAVLAFLGYRFHQSEVDACKDSPEVAVGGDKYSCLDAGNRFANTLAVSFLLLMELGLVILLLAGFFRWQKQRRLERRRFLPSLDGGQTN
jgi:hypothetical protein